ncbi:MAG: signal peptidase I [Candidatus Coprovivens sp.]
MGKKKQIVIFLISLLLVTIQIVLAFNNINFYTNTVGFTMFLIYDIYLIIKLNKTHIRNYNRNRYISRMLIITLIYYIIYFYFGFFLGFLRSPYSHQIFTIAKNIFNSLVLILAIELSRYIYVSKNKDNKLFLVIFTILLIIMEINIPQVLSLYNVNDKEGLFKYIFQHILPLISLSFLFTYIDTISNYKTIMIYRIITILFIYIMPIFPNINWFLDASQGILVPAFFFMLFKYVFTKQENLSKRKIRSSKISLTIAIISMASLVAFMLGAFKCEPVTIVSNSMLPTYSRGDVIVYEKMSSDDLIKLEKNSIIVYRVENQLVAHRVVNVIQENGIIKFQTKGDNNNGPDTDLVAINQIVGVYRFHLKYIGYPSVWLNDFFNNEEAVVETK